MYLTTYKQRIKRRLPICATNSQHHVDILEDFLDSAKGLGYYTQFFLLLIQILVMIALIYVLFPLI